MLSARPLVLPLALLALTLTADAVAPSVQGVISGTVTYRERFALPTDSALEVTLEDLSSKEVIAQTRLPSPGQVPIKFAMMYDISRVTPTGSYAVRARILVGDRVQFTTSTPYRVLTQGHSSSVALVLQRSGAPAKKPATKAKGKKSTAKKPAAKKRAKPRAS